ncbi:HTH-type transcriptional regulator BenM [compost metagenome]
MNTSLSRLSVAVRDLEERLGCSLCRRGSSGFQLTEEGHELFEAAQMLFGDIERFRQQANRLGGLARESLQIGTVDSLISLECAPLPLAVRLFR